MNFPSFGDATAYSQVGAACAAALTTSHGDVFTACYDPLRPVGIVAWNTIPYVLARDPVDAAYVTLTLNILLLCSIYLALMRILMLDPAVRSGESSVPRTVLSGIVFLPILLNLIPHVPVTLSDLPSLAAFLLAGVVSARIVLDPAPAGVVRRYLVAGLLVSLAALLRQHYLMFGLFLLAATFWLDRRPGLGSRERVRCALAFAAGLTPVVLQVANVYAHSGEIWLYETAPVAAGFHRPNGNVSVEALFFSIPQPGAFMVKLTEAPTSVTLMVLRMFAGLFKFQWAVYQGRIPPSLEWWTPSALELARAYVLVGAYVVVTVAALFRAPLTLRLLNATALPTALAVPWIATGHTELRYYLLPRIVLAITVLVWLARALGSVLAGRRARV
jgi:hypothetical protein